MIVHDIAQKQAKLMCGDRSQDNDDLGVWYDEELACVEFLIFL